MRSMPKQSKPPEQPTILLEDGSRVEVSDEWKGRFWRVQGSDQKVYHHVADAPDGEWIYREDEGVRTPYIANPFAPQGGRT